MVLARRNATAILAASILGVAAGAVHGAGEPIALWNANASGIVSYKMYEAKAKVGDFVYVDAHQVHPTQICLGYREMLFKAGDLSTYNTDKASRDPKAGIYPYLAKKDVPIIISPDGAPYITDGHHTLAALLASTQADKTAFGHVVATFYGKSEADFVAFMADPKNNDCYLFGPEGNGLLNTPGPLAFNKLPPTVYSENPAGRMANDFYRSLGWGIKEAGYTSNEDGNKSREATILFANFIEFRWADLYRGKIMWNDKSDEAFYIAVVNANTLAHSESTKDISGSIAARDLPGYLPAKAGDAGPLNITNDAYIVGDICPSALSNNVLTVNAKADTTLVVGGKLSHLGHVQINGGGLASSTVDKGALTTHVVIPAGSGMVVFAGDSDYSGVTTVKAGKLLINGAIPDSPVEVEKGAVVGGSGHVGAISGAGLVSPGNSAGILRAASVDPKSGTTFAFEFGGTGEPDYAQPLNSRNDVLALTSGDAFKGALTAANEVDIYFKPEAIHSGEAFIGGFFAPTPVAFDASIKAAHFRYFIADPKGDVLFGNTHFSPLDVGTRAIAVDVVPAGAGATKGFVTRFQVTR